MPKRNAVDIDLSMIKPRVDTYQGLTVGDLFKVKGEHGKFKFLGAAGEWDYDEDEEQEFFVLWIDAIGPLDGHEQLRSFRPERVVVPPKRRITRI